MFNRNSVIEEVNNYPNLSPQQQYKKYPLFFNKLKFEKFRNISNLEIEFNSPISVITGNNRCGKTTVLLAIACSHYNFQKRDFTNGAYQRNTWGDLMRFTSKDIQTEDWTYYVSCRLGENKINDKRGQRKFATKKWNGVAKKESQIGTPKDNKTGREVRYIDLDRIVPEREKKYSYFSNLKNDSITPVQQEIEDYISYIMQEQYNISFFNSNTNSFSYQNENNKYSSFNSASGEDALTRIITEIVSAPKTALILIEEIEVGLHPEYLRRLMDVIYNESITKSKQFIITTHSPLVMSLVDSKSRIFIENRNGIYKAITDVSTNEAYSKMDSKSFPLFNLYVEDDISKRIVIEAIKELNTEINYIGIKDLIKIVIVGSADKVFNYFEMRKELFSNECAKIGYACILDGDMRNLYKDDSGLLFYHYSTLAPEKYLVDTYLKQYPNSSLKYNLMNINNHFLFNKMVELNLACSKDEAFSICWEVFKNTEEGKKHITELKNFLINCYKHFSPNF